MYAVSSTWSSGNGPPGGEGGDGAHGVLQILLKNGTKLADWTCSSWPDFNIDGRLPPLEVVPSFAMVMLDAGPQVIKLESTSKHLNLDYVQFDLMGAGSTGRGGRRAGAAGAAPRARRTGRGGRRCDGRGGRRRNDVRARRAEQLRWARRAKRLDGDGRPGGATGTAGDGASARRARPGRSGGASTGTAGVRGHGGHRRRDHGRSGAPAAPPKQKGGGGCLYAGAEARSLGWLGVASALALVVGSGAADAAEASLLVLRRLGGHGRQILTRSPR